MFLDQILGKQGLFNSCEVPPNVKAACIISLYLPLTSLSGH